jgi:hypothetical protein
MLTAEKLALRREIGASDTPVIMWNDAERLNELFEVKTGLREPPDLSNNYDVHRGNTMEGPDLDWHERKLGYKLSERGRVVYSERFKFLSATLDAYDPRRDAVIEYKNTRADLDWVIAYYTAQVEAQKHCRGARNGILLISRFGSEPFEHEIDAGDDYRRELFTRIPAFQLCVETMTRPVPGRRIVPPDEWRSIDLDEVITDNWVTEMREKLQVWDQTKEMSDLHAETVEDIKALTPDDVGRLRSTRMNISVTRNRRGWLTIKRIAA